MRPLYRALDIFSHTVYYSRLAPKPELWGSSLIQQACSETSVSEQRRLKNGKMRGVLQGLFGNQPGS
jgi:hypothetical protein